MTVDNGDQPRGAHLGWSLSLFATESRKGPKGANVTVKKTILEGVTGSVRSGNMVALMGASGACVRLSVCPSVCLVSAVCRGW